MPPPSPPLPSFHLPWLQFPPPSLPSDDNLDDPDDYISSLAHQIAHSMLDDDDSSLDSLPWSPASPLPPPQSGLNPGGRCSWSLSDLDGSLASDRSSSRVSLPLAAQDAWDLLCHSDAGVLELKTGGELKGLSTRVALSRAGLRQHPSVVASASLANQKRPSSSAQGSTLCSRENLAPAVLKNLQRSNSSAMAREDEPGITSQYFRASKQGAPTSWGGRGNRPLQHSQTNRGAGRHRGGGGSGGSPQRSSWGGAPDINSSHHFPPIMSSGQQQHQQQHQQHHQQHQQQQPQALLGGNNRSGGMRAIFLGATGSRESGGTGVFLPRRMGCGPESKKKPACSTVLLPSRVVQALNLKVEDILSCPASSPTSPITRRDFSSPVASSLHPNKTSNEGQCWEVSPEISLPTEWTY